MPRLLLQRLAVLIIGAAILRVAVVPPEVCPTFRAEDARASVGEAAAWLERGLRPDGRYTYGYDRKQDALSSDYNLTRHAGVMMGLYRLARTGESAALAAADGGLPFLESHLVRHADWTAFADSGQEARIGPSALAAAALVQRRIATGDGAYDGLIRSLGRFLLAQQQQDGSMLGYWSPSSLRPVPGRFAKFGTGEALWALALLDRQFPGEGWAPPARRLARFIAVRRDETEGYVLTFPDHWAAYGLAELGPRKLGTPEILYARRLAGALGLSSRFEAQTQGHGVNRLARGEAASGAGVGSIGEGLAALVRLSRSDSRLADLEGVLSERLACTVARAAERQADAREASRFRRPELVRGAWFSEGGYTQMDDQRHTMSALQAAVSLLGRGST